MTTLKIHLFGGMRITHADWTDEVKMTPAVQALFAYLLLYRHRIHRREFLANLFWGDYCDDRARGSLSTVLWRLRSALETGDTTRETYLLSTPMGDVGFNDKSDHWLDVAVFEEQVNQIISRPVQALEAHDIHKLENGIQLYAGELLEGFYDDWALRERERLRALHLKGLAHLMRIFSHNKAFEKSIAYGRQILHRDPLREEIHRDVMRLYLESGQRSMAIQQYKTCCKILDAELGIPPMEETQAVYSSILEPSGHNQQQSNLTQSQCGNASPETPDLDEAIQGLFKAKQHFEKSLGHFERAIKLLERIVSPPPGGHKR